MTNKKSFFKGHGAPWEIRAAEGRGALLKMPSRSTRSSLSPAQVGCINTNRVKGTLTFSHFLAFEKISIAIL
jgi:hypothetical protein